MTTPQHAPALTLRRVHLGAGGPLSDVRIDNGLVTEVHPGGEAPRRPGERDTDLDGRVLLPGLWDAHVHIAQWAAARQRLDLAGTASARQAAETVRARLAAGPAPAGPLLGYGFRDGLWPDAPHKDLLDAYVPDHPTVLISADLHCCWINSAGLALLGLGDHPTGLLREHACMEAIAQLPVVPEETMDRWIGEACAAAAERGITGFLDFEYADNIADWTRRMSAGRVPVRVAASVWTPHLEAAIARGLRTGDAIGVPGGGLLEMGPLKLLTDGSLNTRTALCHDPYPGMDAGHAEARGLARYTHDELVTVMRRAAAHGIDCAVHAIGDRANEMALDAFEAVRCRGRIEHAQLVTPEDEPRFAALGVTASIQPSHAVDDRDVADRHWAGRTHRAFPYGALRAAGATLELGSDAPVAPLDPWTGIADAVARTDDDRPAWHPEHRLPLDYVLGAAARGRHAVRVGDPADLAVVDTDPLTADADTLRHMPVHGTLLAGEWTYLSS
ncbi:amidohydrolase [Streptomyces sp. NBC_01429]|uniref:amidohydrolase n=1 Tax=Streptomyces sp. NBC_01429 TaxID=2903862 RepID=UPI002E2805E6|nr:amidohydrolase family protein [Streptomyces sp. NBC_01429]